MVFSIRQKLDRNKKSADKLARDLETFSKYYAQMAHTTDKVSKFVKRHPHVVAGLTWFGSKTVGYKHPDVTQSVDDIIHGESIAGVVDKLLDSPEE